jgi:hypothetical protein
VTEFFFNVSQITNLGLCLILPDNIDTRGALDAIRDLVVNCNIYNRDKRASKRDSNCLLLRDIAAYITWLLRVFGVIHTEEYIGFPVAESEGAKNVSTNLSPWSRVFPEKLIHPMLLQKFPAFYGTQSFIITFTRAHHLSYPEPDCCNVCPPSNLFQIHFNIILPSMPGASKLFSLRFPHQNPVCTLPLPHTCYMPYLSVFVT